MLSKRHAGMITAAAATAAVIGFLAFDRTAGVDVDDSPLGLARALIADGEYARAADTLRAAYRAQPDDPLRIELARAQLSAGDHQGALESLMETFADPVIENAAEYLRAESLLRLRRFNEAEELSNKLMARTADARTLLFGARAAYAGGKIGEAEARLAEALRAGGPALADAWLFRARLALDANDLAVAKAAAARARDAGAHRRDLAALDIETAMREGRYDDAERAIAQMRARARRRAGSRDPLADYLSGMLAAARGDYVAAARDLRATDRWLGVLPNAPLALAMAQDRAGDAAQADKGFLELLREAPGDALVAAAAGERLVAASRLEEAGAMIAAADGAGPAGAYLRLALAEATGDDDAALAAAKSFAGMAFPASPPETVFGPHSHTAQYGQAHHQRAEDFVAAAQVLLSGDKREAARVAEALDEVAETPAMAALAGELYLAAGRDAEAAAAFDRALNQAPQFAAALRGRVRVAVRAGTADEVEQLLRATIEQAPELAPARNLLARVLISEGRPADAAVVLAPIESTFVDTPGGALLYAGALDEAGEEGALAKFARALRRARPADPATVVVLGRAGLVDKAAAAARESLLAAPADGERVIAFREAMRKAGKTAQAKSFLDALGARAAGAAAPQGAIGGEGLEALRRAYLAAPEDARAISLYGTALARAGAGEESARVMREACFWAVFGGCGEEIAPRT